MDRLPRGFGKIFEFANTYNKTECTAGEIEKYFTDTGSTKGQAAGTIRRACEAGFMEKIEYGKYLINLAYISDSSDYKVVIRSSIEKAIDEINSKYQISDLCTMDEDAINTITTAIKSLKKIINEIDGN